MVGQRGEKPVRQACNCIHHAVGGRCGRCGARLIDCRRTDLYVYRFPGPSFDDSQFIQDSGRRPARSLSCGGQVNCHPCLIHFRGSFRCVCMQTDRCGDPGDQQRAGGHGPGAGSAYCRTAGKYALSAFFRRLSDVS